MTWNDKPNRANVLPAEGSQDDRIGEAISYLEDTIQKENVAFLWTGGTEAQVIADLLLYGVGQVGNQPVPFCVIDTGNHFDEMYEFRSDFIEATGDKGHDTVGPPGGLWDVEVKRYDELLDEIIKNPEDPRGYHGHWNDSVELPEKDPIEGLPRSPKEWDVPSSCGALKTVPIKELIEEDGFDTLITGIRAEDPLHEDCDHIEQRREPAHHERVNPLASWSESNVWAYIKAESVSVCELYTQGYRHTDSKCCTDDSQADEYGDSGRDPEKRQAKEKLEEIGYV